MWRKSSPFLHSLFVGFITLFLIASPQTAHADQTIIVVDSTEQEVSPYIEDGDCSLAEAIAAANNDATVDGCTSTNFGTNGPFIIKLRPGETYPLSLPDNETNGLNAFPVIKRDMIIEGFGSTIVRRADATEFRIFEVDGVDFTLAEVVISGGKATIPTNEICSSGIGTPTACGGTVFNDGGHVMIHASTITDSEAELGGAVGNDAGQLTVTNSLFYNNRALGPNGQGGAIAHYGQLEMSISDSTITNNVADKRGGGLQVESETQIDHLTISNNSAEIGGNIRNYGALIRIQNSIVAFGASTAGGDNCATANNGATFSDGYNIDSTNDCAFTSPGDLIETDPQIGDLIDNGGSTDTRALNSNSPAIEAIPVGTNGCTANESRDQRGAYRADGDQRGGTACDIGAFESGADDSIAAVEMNSIMASLNLPSSFLLLIVLGLWLLTRQLKTYYGKQ